MSKENGQNEKLKRPLIISLVLHVLLIALLIWSSFDENFDASAGGGGGDIDAVMVDPAAVVNQYNQQHVQQSDRLRAEQQHEKQAEELQQQAAEQQHQQMAKERLQAQEQAKLQAMKQVEQQQAEQAAKLAQEQQKIAEAAVAKAEAEAEAKAKAEAQAKAAANAKAKAEAEKRVEEKAKQAAKLKAAQEAKAAEAKEKAAAIAKAEAEVKAKAEADKKAKAKAAAEAKKVTGEVDDLLGGLTSGKNAPKQGKGGAAAGQGNQIKAGANGAEVSNYASQIQSAIQSKFYDANSFKGQVCTLKVRLAPNGGSLIDVQAQSGDPALCQAALAAARQAIIPKPPSQAVYEALKNAPVDFKPQ